jgi:hypothetical protein
MLYQYHKILKTKLILLLICAFIISIPLLSNAKIPILEDGRAFTDLNKTAGDSGYTVSEDPNDIIRIRMNVTKTIIQYVLGFLGIIFLILIITGGYQWMTAGGNEETIAKAKKRIINATIGIVIVLAAYVITDFIFTFLVDQTIQAP